MQSRRAVRLALLLAILLANLGIAGGASAAGVTGTLKLDPPTTSVDNGGTVSIKVMANTTVATSGVAASVTFDKAVLQVVSITRSATWATAPLYLAGDAAAIATANKKGLLQAVAASFFPPGSVPAGSQEFITIVFKAVACGSVSLGLPIGTTNGDTTLLDGRAATYGASIKLTTTGAAVTVCQGGSGSPAPGASGEASSVPGDSGIPGASSSVDPNASAPASSDPSPSALPASASPSAPADAASAGTTSEQSGWLTFAIAALAIAAAGLAALILVLTIAAIVAAVVGGVFLVRNWRRFFGNGGTSPVALAEGGAAAQAAGTAGSTGSTGTEGSTPTADGSTAQTKAPVDNAATSAAPPPASQP
jgi:hypothetical protein